MSDKIYCVDCIFFDGGERIPYSYGPPEWLKEKCLSPENFKDSYKEPTNQPVSQPKIINRFNDCAWFVPFSPTPSSSSSSG